MTKLVACWTLMLAVSGAAEAQTGVVLGFRGSYLPLYSGDATVGRVHSWAATLHVGMLLGPGGEAEVAAFYTLSPQNADAYNRAPRIQLAGLLLAVSGGIEASLRAVGTLGLGLIDVNPEALPRCEPPTCFAEGGPSFRAARFPTAIAGVGLDLMLYGPLRLRLDGRGHLPLGADESAGDSGKLRLDVGAGLRLVVR